MKQRLFVLLAMVGLVTVLAFACKKNEYGSTTASDTSSGQSTTIASDSTATANGTVPMASASASLANEDREFVTKSAEGGLAEVNMGTLAAAKATTQEVKDFGNRMVSDHGKANDELKQLATSKGVDLPTDVPQEQHETMDKLSQKSGTDFDKAYMKDMVEDHEKDVKEFEKASKTIKDPDLKAWADKTLPTLQEHLKMAKETKTKVK